MKVSGRLWKREREWKAALVFLVSVLILSVPLTGLISYRMAYAASPPLFELHTDDWPSTASYVVKTDGSEYWAVAADGSVPYSGTNASQIIMSAFNSLIGEGATGTISLQGNIKITSPLVFDMSIVSSNFLNIEFDSIYIQGNFDGVTIKGAEATAKYWWGKLQGDVIRFAGAGYTHTALTIKNIFHSRIEINTIQFIDALGAAGSIGFELQGIDAGAIFNTIDIGRIAGFDTAILLNASGSYPTAYVNANSFCNTIMTYIGTYGIRFYSSNGDISGNHFTSIMAENIADGDTAFAFNGTYSASCTNAAYYICTIDTVGGTDISVSANQHIYVFGGQLIHNVTKVSGTLYTRGVYGMNDRDS